MSAIDNAGFCIFLCLVAGCALAVQATVNGAGGMKVPGQIVPWVTFFGGMVVCFIIWIGESKGAKNLDYKQQLGDSPWYAWIGGLCGAFYVFVITYMIPRRGVGICIALSVVAQMVMGMLVDHFHFMGNAEREYTVYRGISTIGFAAGVVLIMFY
ncbi:hypothetical protein DL89DRAFT_87613 [Linderina pennispora]|uniref:DUF606-domain-containing protein n=1 Tax=Linderina pennispora TaxID=61395 RepID=A0A1Y1WHR9_9FUNG|nr:uncharacterized protein DL89DRAFT_87613 [Linderina pennispora]ORX73069.1 hypothetical protein DL89DRAFT_87613 [Linderina pennispora]